MISSSGTTPGPEPHDDPGETGRVGRSRAAVIAAIVVASVLLVLGISGAVIGSVGSGPLLDDDFEGAHMWTEDDDPIVAQRFVDGGYEIELKQAGVPSVSRHFFDGPAPAKLRFTVDVTVVREAGPQYVGVQCWEGGTHGYSFVLSPDEGYALWRMNGPDDVRMLSEGPAPIYGEGETLRQITIECAGGGANSTLVVASLEGEELGRAEDPEGFDAFGAVGLWSLSQQDGGTVRWDNAKAQAG